MYKGQESRASLGTSISPVKYRKGASRDENQKQAEARS